MTGMSMTRRQLLERAGAAAVGVVGLGLVGDALGMGSAAAALVDTGLSPAGQLTHFVTRPDLTPPAVKVTRFGPANGAGYTFMNAPWTDESQGGSLIRDARGDLVWMGRNAVQHHRLDINAQSYRGKPVLTWWEGALTPTGIGLGVGMIADTSYRTTHVVRAHNGLLVDLHEFNLTPDGTALITAYRKSVADLSAVGGPVRGYVLSGVVQEVDIATGALLFEWDSLNHVPLTESQQPVLATGTPDDPYDYFHVNSIAVASDGDLLVSGRNTWTVYKVTRPAGKIAWRLGGKRSDFRLGPGVEFHWQHHVRSHGSTTLTLFDNATNGVAPQDEPQSRALILRLDPAARRVGLVRAFTHPNPALLSHAMGSAELLPDGGMFVGWGATPYYSEFAADGALVMDALLPLGNPSYRTFTRPWTGHPTEQPAVAARVGSAGATVYASWNGATTVASWGVLAGKRSSSLAYVGSARRTGFETAITVANDGPYFAVEPRDASGQILAWSATERVVS
jgi:hypothetical protein